jgi:hypothetical protein
MAGKLVVAIDLNPSEPDWRDGRSVNGFYLGR